MTVKVQIDSRDIEAFRRALANAPEQIRVKAIGRAMRRLGAMAKSRIAKLDATRIKVDPKFVRERTTAAFNAGGNSQRVILQSGWIHLFKLGAVPTDAGVEVKGRGSYRHAFIATMKSGHTGVFRQTHEGDEKSPIRELFGPNPANDVSNHPDVYLQVLAELLDEHVLPRVAHELEHLLSP